MDAKGVSGTDAGSIKGGLPSCCDPSASVCILDSGVTVEQSPSLTCSENKTVFFRLYTTSVPNNHVLLNYIYLEM